MPVATPVAIPVAEPIVATAVALLIQVPPLVAFVSVVVPIPQMAGVPPMAPGTGFTDNVIVELQPVLSI